MDLALVIFQLLVPVILIAGLAFSKLGTRLEWFLLAWTTVAFTLYSVLTGGWFLVSVYLRFVVLALLLAAVVYSFFRVPRNAPHFDWSAKNALVNLAAYLAPLLVFTVLLGVALSGRFYQGEAVRLVFPLNGGPYHMGQAGGATIVNYHHPYGSQRYALDILKVNGAGSHADTLVPTDLNQYAIFGESISSPCDGQVIARVDNLPDLAPGTPGDTQNAAGNHVFIQCHGFNVLLAHMQQGSLVVAEGDAVKVGDPIGKVGNSGNTSEPHLHIHAVRGGTTDQLTSGEGLPILFDGHFYVRNDLRME